MNQTFNEVFRYAKTAAQWLLTILLTVLILPQVGLADLNWGEPPQVIYHGGKRSILELNVAANTIPQTSWNEFIMGSGNRSGLSIHRRGLYGFEFPEATYPYVQLNGSEGAVIAIEIHPFCLAPKHVARSGSKNIFFNVETNHEFSNWINRNASDSEKQMCADSNGDWEQGPDHGLKLGAWTKRYKCQKLANSFLEQNEKWIVQDDFLSNAWYIKKRECIKSISWY